MTLGLQRSVLLLLCAASALLAGCVSQGKYDDLEGKYNALRGQHNQLQGQYSQLQGQYAQQQQASAPQAAKSSADIATLKKEIDAGQVHISRLQNAIKYTVNSDLLFRSGSWEMSPQGQEVIAKLVPQLAPFQQSKLVVNGYTDNAPVGQALQRQGITSNEVLSQKRAEAVMQYLDLARREAGHDLGAGAGRGGSRRLEQHGPGTCAESPRRGDPGRTNPALTLQSL